MKMRTCKKLRFLSRIISLSLVIAMLVQSALGNGTITLASVLQQENGTIVTENEDAQEMEQNPPLSEEEDGQETGPVSEEPQIIFEVESLRKQNEKHYRLSDGTMMASKYAMDVHYEDENGEWAEIDNRFVYEPATETDAMEGYVTADGMVEFKFAPDTSGEVVRAADGKHSVSFELITEESESEIEEVQASEEISEDLEINGNVSMEEISETEITGTENIEIGNTDIEAPESLSSAVPITFIKGEILNEDAVPETMNTLTAGTFSIDAAVDLMSENTDSNEEEDIWTGDWENALSGKNLVEQAAVDNVVTSVGYENVLPGISLQYVASGSSLKEYILVGARQDSYRYVFKMNLESLVPQIQENKSIILMDEETEEVIYLIPAAFMTDAAGDYSDEVEMTLEENADGTYLLVLDADEEWINSPERTFPVQIDPTLSYYMNTYGDTKIRGSYICEGKATLSYRNTSTMFVGYDSSGEKNYISYIQMQGLPELPKNSVICAARFGMAYTAFDPYGLSAMNVILKEITGTSWDDNFTWYKKVNNGFPATSSTIADSQKLAQDEAERYIYWDITSMVKEYYRNDRAGVLGFSLEAYESMSGYPCAKATLKLRNTNNKPIFQVFYRDTKGIEPYYTYQTQTIGNAGIGYVSDQSSQLTLVVPLLSYESTIMQYSLGMVYNSAFGDCYFSNDIDNQTGIHTKDYRGMYLGTGWKLTAQETVVEVPVTEFNTTVNYLVYNDGDGTEHYFKQSDTENNRYEDEDGLGLTIVKSGNNYTLEDQDGNIKYFALGYLYRIQDANGNKIHIVYNGCTYDNNIINPNIGNRISSIVFQPAEGSAVTIFSMNYDLVNGHLMEVIDEVSNARKIVLGYSLTTSGKWQIAGTFRYDRANVANVLQAKYDYNSIHQNLTYAYDVERQIGIQYDYENGVTGYRVSGFHEYAAPAINGTQTVGKRVKSSSDGLRQTVYTVTGNEGSFESEDCKITSYLFNASGQTINAMSEDVEGNLLGVTSTLYEENDGTSRKNNRITETISGGQAGQNIFSNGGFELPLDVEGESSSTVAENWSHGGTGSVARRPDDYNGTHSLSGEMHYNLYNATTTGEARLYRRAYLEAGKTYTFSAYVNTSDAGTISENGGVYLEVLLSGVTELSKSPVLSYKTNNSVNGGWQRIVTTFTMNYSGNISMVLVWKNASGTMWADDLQLEESSAASRFNYVYNGSFEEPTLSAWSENVQVSISSSEQKQGNRVLRMNGAPDTSTYLKQEILLNKSSNTTFLLSGWTKGNSIPGLEQELSGEIDSALKYWGMMLILHYKEAGIEKDYFYLPFCEYVKDWQYASMAVAPEKSGQTIEKAELRLYYQNNANVAYFDGISLTEEPAQTYTYDEDGNLVSVESTGNGGEDYQYDGDPQNLMEVATEGSGTYEFLYNDTYNEHIPTEIKNDTVTMGIKYDRYGRAEKTTLKDDDEQLIMRSDASYQNGLLSSITDNTGAETRYVYDELRRNISVTDAAENTVYTGYEETWGHPSIVYQDQLISLDYIYTNGNVTQMNRGGRTTIGGDKYYQNYHFAYDVFGNCTGVAVGNYKLAEYSYDDDTGNLMYANFGKNAAYGKVDYVYDNLDRVVSATYKDENTDTVKTYGYQYTSDGNLAGITENGEPVYTYDYDTIGRLIHSAAYKDEKMILYTDHEYDTSNRIKKQSWQIEEDAYSEQYRYSDSDGTLEYMTAAGGENFSYFYDDLNRLSDRTLVRGSSPILKMSYVYRTRNDNSDANTTTQISQLRYLNPNNSSAVFPTLAYTYDVLGNIKTVTPSGEVSTIYTYDAQNQLTKESRGGLETDYVYDTYGNVRNITEQSALGTEESYTFSYSNTQWRDRLTRVRYTDSEGNTTTKYLTYDDVGNPLTYYNGDRNWTFTWKYGKQLSTATDGTNSASYEYDVDGIRKSKTINGKVHDYVTMDGMVIRETIHESYGDIVVDYMYDNNCDPYKIIVDVDGAVYTGYFVLNLQGDVIAIIDASRNKLVEYTYNAWGEQQSCIARGIVGSALNEYNALKYRGYYQDEESGFYYLQNRYYDPSIVRFISPDDVSVLSLNQNNLLQYNLYTYCLNNPVNSKDSEGTFPVILGAIIGGAVAGALVSSVSYMVGCALSGDGINGKDLGIAALTGAVCGGIGGAVGVASNVWVKGIGSAVAGIGAGVVTGISSGNVWNGIIAGLAAGISCFVGASIDLNGLSAAEMAFGTYCTTLAISTPIEIASVAGQQAVSTITSNKQPTASYYIPPIDNVTYPGRTYYEDYGLLYNFIPGYARP